MDNIKKSHLFRIAALILTAAFISLDISYAYPIGHDAGDSTLSTPYASQQVPVTEQAAQYKQSLISMHALVTAICDIGDYSFGNPKKGMGPLPSKFTEYVMASGISKSLSDAGIKISKIITVEGIREKEPGKLEKIKESLSEMGFEGALPDESLVFVLYESHGKTFLVLIADKARVSAEDVPGMEMPGFDKYVVKYLTEDYHGLSAQIAQVPTALDVSIAQPETPISQETRADDTEHEAVVTDRKTKSALSVVLIASSILGSMFVSGCSASDSPVSFRDIVLAVSFVVGAIVLSRVAVFFIYLVPGVMYSAFLASIGRASHIFDVAWRAFFPVSWHLNKLHNGYNGEKEKSSKRLIEMGSSAVPGLIVSLDDNDYDTYELVADILGEINDSRAIKPLKRRLKSEDMSVRETAAETLEKMRWEPVAQEERLEYLFALHKFDELKEMGDPAISFLAEQLRYRYLPLCDVVTDFLARIGTPAVPYLKNKLGNRNRVIRTNAMEALKKMGWHPVNDDDRVVYEAAEQKEKMEREAAFDAAVKKSRQYRGAHLMFVNPLPLMLGADILDSALQDVGPVAAGIIGVIVSIAVFFTIWRLFFPVSWYVRKLNSCIRSISSEAAEKLIDIGSPAVPSLKKKMSDDKTTYHGRELIAEVLNNVEGSARETGKVGEAKTKVGAAGSAIKLFELIESLQTSRRSEFIAAGNDLIKKADPDAETIDKAMMTAEIRERVERAMSIIEGLEKGSMSTETKAGTEALKKGFRQFEADGFIGSVIVKARNAKKEGQKSIIGFENDWIPGMYAENSLQRQAITVLMREIDRIAEALRAAGLDNVEIVRGSSSQLADSVMKAARDSNTKMHNIVVIASLDTLNSDSFAVLRNSKDGDRPFLAGIDPTELINSYTEHGESTSKQLCIRLTQILCMTLELAAGKEPPQIPIIESYDGNMRMVVFLPKAELVDIETLKDNYRAESAALASA